MRVECALAINYIFISCNRRRSARLPFVPRREPSGVELWKPPGPGVLYPGLRIPLICLSETISSYDRWYRSDTHVLRRTEGSSQLSDELPCRAIFTNLTTLRRRRRRRRRKEHSGRCEDDSLPSTFTKQVPGATCTNLRCAATFNEMLIPRSDPAREETAIKRIQRKKNRPKLWPNILLGFVFNLLIAKTPMNV